MHLILLVAGRVDQCCALAAEDCMTRLARETGRGHPRTAHPRPEAEGVPERRSLPMRFAWRVVEHGGVRNHRVCAGVSDPLAGELQHATAAQVPARG